MGVVGLQMGQVGSSNWTDPEPGSISPQPRNPRVGADPRGVPLCGMVTVIAGCGWRFLAQVTKFKPSTWVALDDWPLNEEALSIRGRWWQRQEVGKDEA